MIHAGRRAIAWMLLSSVSGIFATSRGSEHASPPGLGLPIAAEGWTPAAKAGAAVLCDAHTRITVLTDRLFRAEWLPAGGAFEDRASLAFVNRGGVAAVPAFSVDNSSGWCNITLTAGLAIAYRKVNDTRALADVTPTCDPLPKTDVRCAGKCTRVQSHPSGLANTTVATCCHACQQDPTCGNWVFATENLPAGSINCFLLAKGTVIGTRPASDREVGGAAPSPSPSPSPSPPTPSPSALEGRLFASDATRGWDWAFNASDVGGELLGTLKKTPSADMAGCCSNKEVDGRVVYDPKYPLEPGILSRRGWAVLRDDTSLVDNDGGWIAPCRGGDGGGGDGCGRRPGQDDLYIFACGADTGDYEACLGDYTTVGGAMAMPPLHAFGIWWSRHWGDSFDGNPFGPMSQKAIETEVIEGYAQRGLPLQVVVTDMEWHTMLAPPACTEFIGKKGWGGYTWNTSLFPDPGQFTDSMAARGIKLSLNYHPDNGIDVCQAAHKALADAIGLDPSAAGTIIDLNQNATAQQYVSAYFDRVIRPIGADWAWTDSPQVTTWTNHLYDQDMRNRNLRPLVLSRYGGLGNHRSPIGFSGDTLRRFDTLAFEVYMTPRASNIAFGYWSHDIGGFSGGEIDPEHHTETAELFLRWLQFAQFAPVFRTHCRYCEQRIWTFGPVFYPWMAATMRLRDKLVPYIYTMARAAEQTGVGVLRPMYYESPRSDEAYTFDQQYMFGSELLIAPVTSASDSHNISEKAIWLPPGQWYDWSRGALTTGGTSKIVNGSFALSETPAFVRGGAVIPTRTNSSSRRAVASPLSWWVFPGGRRGSSYVYEDDGETMNYTQGQSATTSFNYTSDEGVATFHIGAAVLAMGDQFAQSASWFPATREHRVKVWDWPGNTLPRRVSCGSQEVPRGAPGSTDAWWLAAEVGTGHAALPTFTVSCPATKVTQAFDIVVNYQ